MNQIILPVPPGHPGHASSDTGRGWKISFGLWNALAVLFLILAMAAGGSSAADCVRDEYVDACQAGAGIGTAVLLSGVLFLTVVGNVVLGVAYAIFRKKQPTHIIVQA